MPHLDVQLIEDFVQNPVEAEKIRVLHDRAGGTSLQSVLDGLDRYGQSDDSLAFANCYSAFKPQYNGEDAMVEYVEQRGGEFLIHSTRGEYRQLGSVRCFLKEETEEASRKYILQRINLLGVGGVVETVDNRIVFSQSGGGMWFEGKAMLPPYGMVEYGESEKRMPDPIEALYRKSAGKNGIGKDDFLGAKALALFKCNRDTYNPHLAFKLKTSLTFAQAKEKSGDKEMGAMAKDERVIGDFIAGNWDSEIDLLVPSLMYYVKSEFGSKSFSRLEARLRDRLTIEETDMFKNPRSVRV